VDGDPAISHQPSAISHQPSAIDHRSSQGTLPVPTALDEIVAELSEAEKQERIELLIDFARSLPPLPERYAGQKDEEHRVHECQSPVFLFVELDGDRVTLHADVPPEAPTVRGFVSILVTGLKGATVADVMTLRGDLIQRLGLLEILGMQRLNGLNGVLHHVKSRVARAAVV
jgi:cysteine desulfuration protein SufE